MLHYTNSGGPTQIPVMAYQELPGDYCAYYTPGMTMARGALQASVDEYLAPTTYVEEPDLTVEIPSSSTPGLIVLITALVLTGALCIVAYRRFRMAQ